MYQIQLAAFVSWSRALEDAYIPLDPSSPHFHAALYRRCIGSAGCGKRQRFILYAEFSQCTHIHHESEIISWNDVGHIIHFHLDHEGEFLRLELRFISVYLGLNGLSLTTMMS